jgi:hypothetical protein
MSWEVFNGDFHSICKNYQYYKDNNIPFVHDAVHDAESMLWVFVEICLSRKGPGMDMKRDELKGSPYSQQATARGLRATIYRLFEAHNPSKYKGELLATRRLMEEAVVPHFHPYFDNLKPLVLQWWNILFLAYKFRAYEYHHIHELIGNVLQSTINNLSNNVDTEMDSDDTKREITRRRDERQRTLQAFSKPPTPHSLESLQTPSSHDSDENSADSQSSPSPLESPTPLPKRRKLNTGSTSGKV